MMNKKFSRLLTIALALMLVLSLAPSAFAINGSNGASTKVPVEKTLEMNADAVVTDVTFTFNLAADTTVTDGSITGNSYPLYQGIVTGVTYTKSTNTGDNDLNGSGGQVTLKFNASDSFSGTPTKSYAKTFEIDFSGVNFTNPGVYRYKFTEATLTGYATDTATYYIDVYVEYYQGTAEELTIGQIIVTKDTQGTVGSGDNKVTKIELKNSKKTYDLELDKKVAGNQGNRNQYFKFTVTITDPTTGTWRVDTTGNTYTTTANPTTIAAGSATVFYLKHNEKIIIKDLPEGAKWTIVEDDYTGATTDGGYTTTIAATGDQDVDTDTARTASDNESGITAATVVTYTNTRTGAVPTGVLLTIAPFAALMAVGAAGMTVMLRKKKAEED